MKIAVTIVRIIVGLLFIFSGLVKANDPLGLSYKMQEFFEIWGFSQFDSWTLLFSILMNAFEIIAGFALLLGWRTKLFTWLLLALIIFFTFLTGYTYFTGKPTNCGCFGDCLVISSKTSFLKDVVLAILIAFLLWQRHRITPVFSNKTNTLLMLLITIFSFGIQWYSLTYLPIVDCLPYKRGNNISEKMKMPANAIPDSTVISFVYEKDGKQVEFTADKFPADFNDSYKFVSRYDKVIRKGRNNEPPIKGFVLTGATGADSTSVVLDHPFTILLFNDNFKVPVSVWKQDFEKLYQASRAKNIPIYGVVSNRDQARTEFAGTLFSQLPLFNCDYTAIRTAARTSPTIYLLQKGSVLEKVSHKNIDLVIDKLEVIPSQQASPVEPPPGSDVNDSVNNQTRTNQLP